MPSLYPLWYHLGKPVLPTLLKLPSKTFRMISPCRERRFGKMSQINSGESLDTADEFSSSEKDRKQQEPERRLTLKERQARRSGMLLSCMSST